MNQIVEYTKKFRGGVKQVKMVFYRDGELIVVYSKKIPVGLTGRYCSWKSWEDNRVINYRKTGNEIGKYGNLSIWELMVLGSKKKLVLNR
jgi:hypothetical protein